MVDKKLLEKLEEEYRGAELAAKKEIEQAESHLAYYRSKMDLVRDSFSELAHKSGVNDDPEVKAAFARISDEYEKNIDGATREILELEENYKSLKAAHVRNVDDVMNGIKK